MSIPRRIEVLGLGGAKALTRAQDAATSAVAKAAEAVAAALEAKGYRDQASTIAGLPTEAAAQKYNIENDPGVKAALSASIGQEAATPQVIEQVAASRYAKLMPFYAALSKRESSPCVIACVGDSTREGVATTGFANTDSIRAAALMRAKYPTASVVGGRGFLGATNVGAVPNWPCTLTGGSVFNNFNGVGAKRSFWLATSVSHVATYTLNGTSFDLVYQTGSGHGVMRYRIDGGTWIGIATASPSDVDGVTTRVTFATAGPHTVEVSGNSDGGVWFSGIVEYNGDETKGIKFHNLGISGDAVKLALAASAFHGNKHPSLTSLEPDLLWVRLGANDAIATAQNQSVFDFKAKTIQLLKTYRDSWPTRTVPVVWDVIQNFAVGSEGVREPWPLYREALLEVEATDPNLVIRDLFRRLPAKGAASNYGLYPDWLHFSDTGHQFSADHFVDFVSPR